MDKNKKKAKNESIKEPDNVIDLNETHSPPKEAPQKDSHTVTLNEIEELKKDSLYLRAEFENYKKQAIKERALLIKYGSEELAVALLDVLDNFDRALDMELNADTMESFKEGVHLTASGLKSVLNRFGIEEVDSINQPFDPALHEAMGHEESAEVSSGHITQVFKKPYRFHKKIIRPGQVIIAKEPKDTKKAD